MVQGGHQTGVQVRNAAHLIVFFFARRDININIASGEKNEMVSIAHLNPCLVPSLRAIHYLQQCTGVFTAACATSGCNDPAVV